MRVKKLHGWQLSTPQALELQRRLAVQVSVSSEITAPHFIAGVDISLGRGREMATGAVVVLSYPQLRVVEVKLARGRLDFPYVPGLLSFRESPLILAACERLSVTPDLVLVDGQGIAHPRRFGLASHLGILLGMPTIGCAKSLLCGKHEEAGVEPGDYADIVDKDETIGVALRTKVGVKPVYVSIGHMVSLQAAIHWVMMCCRGYRLPEPTRLAHLAAGGNLKPVEAAFV
ncbi:deoxyribonuclease V [Chloroflexota bacterium]